MVRQGQCRRARATADRLAIFPCRTIALVQDERASMVEDDLEVDDAYGVALDDAATCRLVIPVFHLKE